MPRSILLLALLVLGACGAADRSAAPVSPCQSRLFEGSRFTLCAVPGGAVEVRTADAQGRPYRSFAALEMALDDRAGTVAFGMNAGMFDEDGRAIGLLIENGKQLHPLNTRKGGGNFHLMPNGVFVVHRDGRASVVTTEEFQPADSIAWASQSGPMLVIDGKLHPAFERDGSSRHIRNGVGIAPNGTAMFAISDEPVSFGKFARFFRDEVKVRDALYFDGSVSSLWDPANGVRDAHAPLGPMVVVFKRAESAPGRAGRARP